MSTSKSEAQTALIYDGISAEGFLVFDRQTKRWLRRKCKGLTKWFWDAIRESEETRYRITVRSSFL